MPAGAVSQPFCLRCFLKAVWAEEECCERKSSTRPRSWLGGAEFEADAAAALLGFVASVFSLAMVSVGFAVLEKLLEKSHAGGPEAPDMCQLETKLAVREFETQFPWPERECNTLNGEKKKSK